MDSIFTVSDDTQGPWTLDLGRLMIPEAKDLKRYTGMAPLGWIDALEQNDPLAAQFAVWLARTRAGEDVAFADVDLNLLAMRIVREADEEDPVPSDDGVTEDNASVVPTSPPEDIPGGQTI